MRDGRAVEKSSREFAPNIWSQLSTNGEKWQILRENPSRDFYHPCSGEDYIGVLERMPAELTDYVSAIVLCQTSREDELAGIDARRRYSCVLMNAFPVSNEMLWPERPTSATV